jgi:hypothetical protein
LRRVGAISSSVALSSGSVAMMKLPTETRRRRKWPKGPRLELPVARKTWSAAIVPRAQLRM